MEPLAASICSPQRQPPQCPTGEGSPDHLAYQRRKARVQLRDPLWLGEGVPGSAILMIWRPNSDP
ncbi:hypothetical protein T4E_2337 [Trichinella pseudospiralis]|uniref:Uncharacterized protein n=1 Tax=Trichinella pseudospiralis TaxID=6337 RepID=A0A0V0YGN4_TRIPS|nr:hypothetical protein T4E_2337 [Trichinella pseudospiralis]